MILTETKSVGSESKKDFLNDRTGFVNKKTNIFSHMKIANVPSF